ncbi:hypothetical protein BGZ79_002054 [Entomortierella chlamydospora]|nr:hypothetical protein BGZ79_002054 [Entomortierella chlamydospora]
MALLKLMQIFKYGITTVSAAAPALSNLKLVEGVEAIRGKINTTTKTIGNLVDEVINFLGTRQIKAANIDTKSSGAEFDKTEALEGAVDGTARVLGNLYRTVTLCGHVKWVCLGHYRETYKDAGKTEIVVTSNLLASQFRDTMVKAREVLELDINLG